MKAGNQLFYLMRKTWHYSEGNRHKIVQYMTMLILANSIALICRPLILAHILNTLQQQGINQANIKSLFLWLSLLVVVPLIFWSLHGPARCVERYNSFRARLNYRSFLLKGVMTMPMEWHTDHHSGDTIDKIEKGTNALFDFSENGFEILKGFLQLVISYSVLLYFSPLAALVALSFLLLSIWITKRFDRIMIPQYKTLNKAENNISESVFDAISNITTVIILRVERLIYSAIIRKAQKPFELFRKNQRLNEVKWFLTTICCNTMIVLALGVYFWRNIGTAQGVMIGSIYLLIQYLDKISELFFDFTGKYSDIVKRCTRVMNAEELAADFKTENFTNHVLPKTWKNLSIKNLNFSYHSEVDRDLHLEDVSLSLAHGEHIALVGESGSGKTTLLKLMRDLYCPASASLTVDGREISEGFSGISRAIALVPQNPEIFATTILENITLGAEYDQSLVRYFTDMACFTDVVEELPHKLDSSIKEKGVNLSGGQQQRLALARGLLACHDKDVVLLDEPTSSLDTATEMKVYQNIFREFKDKTIISSIHRLHLLPLFDKIYLFNNGRITASGSLVELLGQSLEFQKLWTQYTESNKEYQKTDT